MDTFEPQIDFESLFAEYEVADFLHEDDINPSVSVADTPSPLSEIENLLMSDAEGIASSSSDSDYHKFLEDILVEPIPQSDDQGFVLSDEARVDPVTPQEVPPEPVSKKQIRQMRNRDAAVKSRERKKVYVKNLETKSRYFEGECRRLEHLLQCCYAENHALRLCLQSRGGFGAPMTMQESAVLLLESLLLGSLLWFLGIMCQLSLPLPLWLTTVLPPRENMDHKGLRRVALKGPNSNNISDYFLTRSFVKSRRCQASRTKMKFDFIMI